MTEIKSLSEGDDVTFDAGPLTDGVWAVVGAGETDAGLFTVNTATIAHGDTQRVLMVVGGGEVSVATVDGREVASVDQGDILLG